MHVDNSAETFEQPHNVGYKTQTPLNAQTNSHILRLFSTSE